MQRLEKRRIYKAEREPEVTIGLTFYNNAATLKGALQSIFSQTFENWELIVIDDHSSDGSFEIVESVKDPRIRVYKEKKRMGFVAALNKMTHLARGKYYARMDADDMMHPDRLSKQIGYLKAHSDIDVVDTAMYSMDQQCKVTGVRNIHSLDLRPIVLLRGRFLAHATVMGRTKWFQKNLYDQRYIRAEDCELWCRTFKTSRFGRIKEALYFVREGLVNVRNYLLSCQTVRHINKTYGPLYIGKYYTLRLILESYIKAFTYRIFALFNSHDALVHMRSRKLSEEEKIYADGIIGQIKSTSVPGL
jgi:glycosyltransferase involved in cell wall biosynthesis